jgi:hypothetical protein
MQRDDPLVSGRIDDTVSPTWELKGRELVNCSCDYGCNCQFNGVPDMGYCDTVIGIEIDEGYRGVPRPDGLRIAAIYNGRGRSTRAMVRRF